MMEYCCKEFGDAIEEGFFQKRAACRGGNELSWFVLFEEYPSFGDKEGEMSITFCPFCGNRLEQQ